MRIAQLAICLSMVAVAIGASMPAPLLAEAASAETGATKAMIFIASASPRCGEARDKAVRRLTRMTRGSSVIMNRLRGNGSTGSYDAVVEVQGTGLKLTGRVETFRSDLGEQCVVHAYLVKERVVAAPDPVKGKPMQAGGMKVYMLVSRKPGLSADEFDAHWAGPHARIAMENPVPPSRYVQNVVKSSLFDAPPIDGIGEQVFTDPDYMAKRAALGPDVAALGAADAQKFIDMKSIRVFNVDGPIAQTKSH